jgi:RND family efflux transporter MFP subunit
MTRTDSRGLSLLLAVLLVACGGGVDAVDDGPTVLPSVQVAADNIAMVDSLLVESGPILSGSLIAERSARLLPQVGGTIIALPVRVGMAVRRGAVIAVIDTMVLADQARAARLGVQSAELAAADAMRNRDRSEELHRAGAIAQREVEGARTTASQATAVLEDARARLASARQRLADAVIRAPFTGVVAEVPASVGDVVSATGGGIIAVVVDPTVLELEAGVPAQYLGAMRAGARVQFAVPAQPGRLFEGTIARVSPAIDVATGQVVIYVRVPNPDGVLAAGLFTEGRVTVASARGLAIPFNALDPQAASPSVRRIRGGMVESVVVELGVRDELLERVEVRAGLGSGDTVLVAGALGTPLGAQIRITNSDR